MIRKLCLLFLLMLPLPAFAAASFTASVDGAQVQAGEAFALELTLSGASAKSEPDIGALRQNFDIMGQGQTSQTSIVNGHVTSSTGWQLTMIPKQAGHLTVPAISIDTDKGRLDTQPIALDSLGQAPAATASSGDAAQTGRAVTIEARADPTDPYQNQPFTYNVHIVARTDIGDLSLGDITADNAIIQPLGKPEGRDGVENGMPVKIIDVTYLITPLKAGPLNIAPAVIQGSVESAAPPQRMRGMNNGFIDPMALFEEMGGFMQRRPFKIAGNAVTVNVKAPAAAMDPWLPLKNLRIVEKAAPPQAAKTGESITRSFTLIGDGIAGSQLPSLEPQLQSDDFKIYADKPKTSDSIDRNGSIVGQREESYSLIPLKAGSLTLPEIKMPWWNIDTGRIAYATVPARTVDVAPGAQGAEAPRQNNLSSRAENPAPPADTPLPAQTHEIPVILYGVVGALTLALLAALFVAFHLQRKINRHNAPAVIGDTDAPPAKPKPRGKSIIAWDDMHSVQNLNDALQAYARDHWDAPPHADLETVFARRLAQTASHAQRQEAEAVIRDLTAALYAGRKVDLEKLKIRCRAILINLDKPDIQKPGDAEKLPDLNPS